jgi:hypothetical protein
MERTVSRDSSGAPVGIQGGQAGTDDKRLGQQDALGGLDGGGTAKGPSSSKRTRRTTAWRVRRLRQDASAARCLKVQAKNAR